MLFFSHGVCDSAFFVILAIILPEYGVKMFGTILVLIRVGGDLLIA